MGVISMTAQSTRRLRPPIKYQKGGSSAQVRGEPILDETMEDFTSFPNREKEASVCLALKVGRGGFGAVSPYVRRQVISLTQQEKG